MSWVPTGDYGEQHRVNSGLQASGNILAADTGPVTVFSAKSADHVIRVQRIVLSITTYSAKTVAFADSTGTPVQVALFSIPGTQPTASGFVNYVVDFGPHGFALTKGKNLVMTLSAAGLAFAYTVDGYQRLVNDTGVIQASTN